MPLWVLDEDEVAHELVNDLEPNDGDDDDDTAKIKRPLILSDSSRDQLHALMANAGSPRLPSPLVAPHAHATCTWYVGQTLRRHSKLATVF